MPEIGPDKYLVMMSWDDVPHIDAQEQQSLLESTPPHMRDARRKGIPSMGVGAIYPVPESDILVEPFQIPDYWPRCAGLDVGWRRTACVWAARDRNSLTTYLYSEYYRAESEPSVHAHGIRSRGDWIPIAIDPNARGRGSRDGEEIYQNYLDLGLNIYPAKNAVEAGIDSVWMALSHGQLKIFDNLQNWLMEYRLYRRDEKGKIVKANDHLMDATRYLVMTGLDYAIVKPKDRGLVLDSNQDMNKRTGY